MNTKRYQSKGTPFVLWLVSALLVLALAGCAGSADATESLTVYSGRSESLVGPIIQQFGEATGINVSVKYAGTSELAATLREEGSNTPADLFFAQDPGGLAVVSDMLAPLPPDLLGKVPEWARAPDSKWVGLSGRARVVVYNTDRLTEADLPDDIFDFTDPKWHGRIGVPPTNASFQTMVTGMRSEWGEERTRLWLEGIHANEARIYENNTSIVAAVAAGEIDVGFVNHYYLHRFLEEEGDGFTARNYHPRAGGPGAIVMVAGAGVLTASENQETAHKFLEFMLSPVAQQYFASSTFEYPLVDGVRTARGLVPMAEINNPNATVQELADLTGSQNMMRQVGILP